MSDTDLTSTALQLLDQQQRLIERLTAEATELRAELRIWQTRAAQWMDRALATPPAPAVPAAPVVPGVVKEPKYGKREVCSICTMAFITKPGYTKICPSCRGAQPLTTRPPTSTPPAGGEGSGS